MSRSRCQWAGAEGGGDLLMLEYHDREWGVPVHDDRLLFEFLVLEGAQAGLSWDTILKKRENYRAAFDHFDPVRVAAYDEAKIEALLLDPGIVRNRLKVNSIVQNARAFLAVQAEFGTFKLQAGYPGLNPMAQPSTVHEDRSGHIFGGRVYASRL